MEKIEKTLESNNKIKSSEKLQNKESNIKPHNLKIIGAGWGRTGTRSLKTALDILGYNCYHGCYVFYPELKKQDVDFFINASILHNKNKGNEIDFSKILEGFDAGVDINISKFYKELFIQNPKAKVILTIRDFNKWYDSFNNTLFTADQQNAKKEKMVFELFNKMYYETLFEGQFRNKEFIIQKYKDHIEEVKSIIPKDQLLLFDITQGWEPLCKFLNKEIPNETFPNTNDSKSFWERVNNRRKEL